MAHNAPSRDVERRRRAGGDRLAREEAGAVLGELLRGLVAAVGFLLHALQGYGLDVARDTLAHLRGRARGLVDYLLEKHKRRHRLEGGTPGQHLVENRTQRVDVAARVRGAALALRLLGADVEHGPHERPRARQLRLRGLVEREAEVGELGSAALLDQDVRGLDVTVNDAGLVRGADGLGDLLRDRDRLLDGQAPPADPLVERVAADQLHRHVVAVLPVADLVYRDDVLVLEPRGGPGLALEAADALVRARPGEEDLERDDPVELGVARLVYHRLRAAAELPDEFVLGELPGHASPEPSGIVWLRGTKARARRPVLAADAAGVV